MVPVVTDLELRDKITETHTNVKHILNELDEGRRTFKDHDNRIRSVEKKLQFVNGKIIIITMVIVALTTFLVNISM